MQVRCPECHDTVELLDDSSFRNIICSNCGSGFSLVGGTDATTTLHQTAKVIGKFELLEMLGVGGFGAVWKAKDMELGRTVAVKIPRKQQLSAEESEQFLREARAAAQLKHPNIVPVHEVGRDGETVFIVSDYVDGLTLSDWLSGPRPPVRTAVQLCSQIAGALHAAHERGIVHRDLKASNVMLDRQNVPYVMDFGLAKWEARELTIAATGQVLGTPAYMAPEQARGDAHQADRRADVYALGVILFELLTGKRPFSGNPRMLIHQVLTADPPSPRKFNRSVPADVETITLKCLEKTPEQRFSTAKELQEELQRFLAGEPIKSRPISHTLKLYRWCRRRPAHAGWLVTAAALLVTLVASIVGIAALQRTHLRATDAQQLELLDAQIDSLRSAAPRGVPYLIASLRPSREVVVPELLAVFEEQNNDPVHRLHVAFALAELGHASGDLADFIVGAVVDAAPAEGRNVISAIRHLERASKPAITRTISQAEARKDWRLKARLAIVELHLGRKELASDMLQFEQRTDPIQRTTFIETFSGWHGDVVDLATPHWRASSDPALISGICLALGSMKDATERERLAWQESLSSWYLNHAHAGTHSAAGWALQAWDLQLPEITPSAVLTGSQHWMVTPTGLTMLRIPSGEFHRPARRNQQQKVRITRDYLLSDREITVGLFEQFIEDTAYDGPKPEDWQGVRKQVSFTSDHPVQQVNWYDAAMFCNWLSRRESLEPCYVRTDGAETAGSVRREYEGDAWRSVDSANGYRLPSEAQWEHACRAGTSTSFAFGDEETWLSTYAVYFGNSNSQSATIGTKLCNAWGLFDMHGNVREWCGDWKWDYGEAAVVVDPLGPGSGTSKMHRGGSWNAPVENCRVESRYGTNPTIRDDYLGFRVARSLPVSESGGTGGG